MAKMSKDDKRAMMRKITAAAIRKKRAQAYVRAERLVAAEGGLLKAFNRMYLAGYQAGLRRRTGSLGSRH